MSPKMSEQTILLNHDTSHVSIQSKLSLLRQTDSFKNRHLSASDVNSKSKHLQSYTSNMMQRLENACPGNGLNEQPLASYSQYKFNEKND